jgi:hypothetical protein
LLLGGACLTSAACGSSSDEDEPTIPANDAGPDAPVIFVNDAAPDTVDAPPECPKCSSDLHRVIDCDGTTLMTCPDDQGCDPVTGGCIPACDSARANQSTIGCEYYGVQPDGTPPAGNVDTQGCYAMFVANTWSTPASIAVDRDGASYDLAAFARIPEGSGSSITYEPLVDGKIPPGQVAILFLSYTSSFRCPEGVTAPGTGWTTVGTSRGTAFHVTSDRPVVAYDIYPYGGGDTALTSATLLLPTSAWNDNYMTIDPYYTNRVEMTLLATQIVANEDATSVTIVPTRDIAAGKDVVAAPKNVPTTYTLDKGQVLGLAELKGLTGSILKADKPIGVWSSSYCINVPEWTGACDSAHQQLFPIKSLGSEYVAVRYRSRVDGKDENPPWRIMAVADNTQLKYDPVAPDGAPLSLKAGELATFRATGPFVVSSQDDQHPIYVSAHMTGSAEIMHAPDIGLRGDAEFVNVVPARQFLSSYVFFTDPTYPETNLVVVRARGADRAFHDVTLDCAGTLGGWQPVGSGAEYEYTRIDLVRHDFAPQNGCDNGRHEITSDAPFGLTVWGWGSEETRDTLYSEVVSYAYPAGASVRSINKVEAKPIPK